MGPLRIVRKILWVFAAGVLFILFFYGALDFALETQELIPPAARLTPSWARVEADATNPEGGLLQYSPDSLWELRPGAKIEYVGVNAAGFRGPAVAKEKSQKLRIAVLGDGASLGLAYGLEDATTWPRVLELKLRAENCDAEVLNFSVPCFTAPQAAAWFRARGAEWKPDLLLIAFGAYSESNPAAAGRTDAEEMLRARNIGPRLKRFSDRFGTLRFLRDIYFENRLGAATRADPKNATVRATIPQFETALAEIVQLQKQIGGAAVFLGPPRQTSTEIRRPGAIAYDEAIIKIARECGVPFFDVRGAFRAASEPKEGAASRPASPESDLFADLYHPSGEGHILWAEFVEKSLFNTRLLENPRRPK